MSDRELPSPRPWAPASTRAVPAGREPGALRGAKSGWLTLVLAGLTLAVLFVSVPGALREAYEQGGFYLFSRAFLEDLPKRLAGPGRFRFVFQPLVATILGIRSGVADARAGRAPYIWELLTSRGRRGELAREGFGQVVNVVLMGILLDSVFQWVILGASYPGAALVVGPVLIATPYALARALSNRVARRGQAGQAANVQPTERLE